MAEQVLPIPIGQPVYRNVDKEELTDLNYRLVNAYKTELQGTKAFPGYEPVIVITDEELDT